ncbi:relaxase/mobilization nuclease domain-containing protein [Maribacter forsetii]|uniref:relaxase/mobilization nuclease domain-containing protein n=1 Tax=Maribacter forsetii TaxID=444515 RepID=UPI00056A7F55|nr:relaxase/mobilization nuclease domain-containing protein [Maribacter forsetii]
MIAKQIKGKDFYGLIVYHDKKVKTGKAYVLDSNIEMGKPVDMTKEFNVVRQLRPNLGKAVYHVSLNLPPGDQLSDKDFSSLADDYLNGMGFEDNQYLIYMHTDQEHQHLHIIANRVMFSGDVVSDSGDYKRSQKLVRELERKYRLTVLSDNLFREKAALTQNEIAKALRTGDIPVKNLLQERVKVALKSANNVKEFIDKLKRVGVTPQFKISKSTDRVMGISFKYKDIIYKGSTLGRKFSWNNILKQIDYEQSRDRTIIFKTNSAERGNKEDINDFKKKSKINSLRAREVDGKSKSYLDGGKRVERASQKVEGKKLKLGESRSEKYSVKLKIDSQTGIWKDANKVLRSYTSQETSFENELLADIDRKKRKKKGRGL